MKVIANESTVFIDVDDTLVMWGTVPGDEHVKVQSPHDGMYATLRPHHGHIKVLKDRKARGSFIVVWSSGGFAWAEAVVKALGLGAHVDICMTKPHMFIDDKQAHEIMGERLYIPYGDGYGRN